MLTRCALRLAFAHVACCAAGCGGQLGTDREPIVKLDERPLGPVVQLHRATLPQPLTAFAVHYWFVAWDPDRASWERWEVWQDAGHASPSWGHVHRDLMPPDAGVGGGEGVVERQWYGAEAHALLEVLHTPRAYPLRAVYRAWPGPNSNTYAAWVLERAHVAADLDPRAIGKDWRGFVGAGATTTRTGVMVSTPVIGLKVGLRDGIVVSVLCLSFGAKLGPPALETPLGSLGGAEQ